MHPGLTPVTPALGNPVAHHPGQRNLGESPCRSGGGGSAEGEDEVAELMMKEDVVWVVDVVSNVCKPEDTRAAESRC